MRLSFSALNSIDPNTFNGPTGLQSIDLSFNQLASIDPAAFKELTSLKESDLSFNNFPSTIDKSKFPSFTIWDKNEDRLNKRR